MFLCNKDGYEELRHRIEEAANKLGCGELVGDLADFSGTKPNNHAPIIKVLSLSVHDSVLVYNLFVTQLLLCQEEEKKNI